LAGREGGEVALKRFAPAIQAGNAATSRAEKSDFLAKLSESGADCRGRSNN
jgi:hypothetical protein